MSDSSNAPTSTIAAYLRVASMAISLYDYLETLPTAWRFYKEHYRNRRISLSIILFISIRCTSIAVITLSNFGFFYKHFTSATCHNFYLVPAVFKVMQGMISQAILGIRAWNLSRRSRWVTCVLIVVYTVACILQWITSTYHRTPKLGSEYMNCRAFNEENKWGAWVYYQIAVIYDFLTTTISITYLLKYKSVASNSMMSRLSRMMLYDGIGYFIALTAVNVLNVILYKGTRQDIQTAGASLAYCISWIMSQRLLIHLYDASRERRMESINDAITITQNLESAREINHAVRTQFEQKSGLNLTVPDLSLSTHQGLPDPEVAVHVRIEHTVNLDRHLRTFELENYSRSGRYTIRDRQSRH